MHLRSRIWLITCLRLCTAVNLFIESKNGLKQSFIQYQTLRKSTVARWELAQCHNQFNSISLFYQKLADGISDVRLYLLINWRHNRNSLQKTQISFSWLNCCICIEISYSEDHLISVRQWKMKHWMPKEIDLFRIFNRVQKQTGKRICFIPV